MSKKQVYLLVGILLIVLVGVLIGLSLSKDKQQAVITPTALPPTTQPEAATLPPSAPEQEDSEEAEETDEPEKPEVQQLDPLTIPKFVEPLVIPPAMQPVSTGDVTKYEIAVRQFEQQVLPSGFPMTTVWGYGKLGDPLPGSGQPTSFNYPAFTIEARANEKIQVT